MAIQVTRNIILNPVTPKISVGRASKSPSKAFHSAGDNAWFDSPVMSRDHAEISLNLETEALSLRDIGSMHGTSINESQLVNHIPAIVRDGDLIVFGAEVKRGSEMFPPCKFIINYEICPYKAANTFAFPESSDFDEDEETSLSGSDLGSTEPELTYNDKTIISTEVTPKETGQFKNEINFARGDPPSTSDDVNSIVSQNSHFNLQRITQLPEDSVQYSEKEEIYTKNEQSSKSLLKDSSQFSLVLDSKYSKGSEIEIWTNEMKNISLNNDKFPEKSASESSVQTIESPVKCRSLFIATEDNNPATHKDSVSLSEDESDIQAEYDLSNAGNEGVKENGNLDSEHSCTSTVPHDYDSLKDKQLKKVGGYDHTQFTISEFRKKTPASSIEGHGQSVALSDQNFLFEQEIKYMPKDVAPLKVPTPIQEHKSQVGVSSSVNKKDSKYRIFGEKSGKPLHVTEAKESNNTKSTFTKCLGGENTFDTCLSHLVFGKQLHKKVSPASKNSKVWLEQNSTSLLVAPSFKDPKLMEASDSNQCNFIEELEQEDTFVDGESKPDLNIFSTSVCNTSTDSAMETLDGRSYTNKNLHLCIKSDNSSLGQKTCKKRKSDAISEEYQSWTRSSSVGNQKSSNILSKNHDCKKKFIAASILSEPRPSKKQKILENFGYAALGGLAAAIGLFSALVATAPDFQ